MNAQRNTPGCRGGARRRAWCLVPLALLCAATTAASAAEREAAVTSQCVIVPANQEWMGTGITVSPSEFVCVKGDGLWSHGGQGVEQIYPYYGPEGYARDVYTDDPENFNPVLHVGALVGKIGPESYPFLIRQQICFVPRLTAELMLSMNDAPGTFGNNDGSLRVQIVKRPATWPLPTRVKMSPELCASPK